MKLNLFLISLSDTPSSADRPSRGKKKPVSQRVTSDNEDTTSSEDENNLKVKRSNKINKAIGETSATSSTKAGPPSPSKAKSTKERIIPDRSAPKHIPSKNAYSNISSSSITRGKKNDSSNSKGKK